MIDADIRNPLIAKLIPPLEVDTVVHNQIVRQPGHGLSPQAMHDVNVIGSLQLLAALEKAPDGAHDHRARLRRDLRGGAPRPAVLHRGDDPPVPAALALPARRGRDRELLRDLLAAAPRGGLHDAPLPARDRALGALADHSLPLAARVPDLPRVRPAAPGGARARRARRARGGRGSAGSRSRERGGRGHDRPGPHDQARAPGAAAAGRRRSSARSPRRRGAPG